MSKLYVTRKFYDKFLESDASKVAKLYGYKNRDAFFAGIIDRLNTKYPFLNIDGVEIMSAADASIYSMYNGFVRGDFTEYKEFLVSFSDPYTKEGNTIISQQLMPMLQQRINHSLNFLYDKKIKRVFMLTSHKATPFEVAKNTIKEDTYGSTLQVLVKCLNTLNFDVIMFFPILNLDVTSRFQSIKELVDNIDYIRARNTGNLQHKQFELIGDTLRGSFSQAPKGQDEKYFALRFLTAIFLNKHNKFDVSQAYSISGRSQMMEMLYRFGDYVEKNDIIYDDDRPLSDAEFARLIQKEEDFLTQLDRLAERYGSQGTRVVTSEVRLAEVQEELRKRLIKEQGCRCLLCSITNRELLVASHIKPACECDIYGKGDTQNGLLLCAIHDRLFDRALISFSFVDGKIMISDKLTQEEIETCHLDPNYCLPPELMTEKRIEYLMWHNDEFEKKESD